MIKIACLVFGMLASSALADVSSVVDAILAETRSRIPDSIASRPLHYSEQIWNPKGRNFVSVADLAAHNGHMLLGKFKREGTPIIYGSSQDGIVESRFLIDFKVNYDNYTAVNFTSGDKSVGSMSVSYDVAEMFTWIKISKQGSQCVTSVSTYTPISMSDPVAKFSDLSSTQLPQTLFTEAKYTLNFYMNNTLVEEGLPTFADVVSKATDLCSLKR